MGFHLLLLGKLSHSQERYEKNQNCKNGGEKALDITALSKKIARGKDNTADEKLDGEKYIPHKRRKIVIELFIKYCLHKIIHPLLISSIKTSSSVLLFIVIAIIE